MSFNGISKLAGHIDISCVQAFHTKDEIDKMIRLAREHRFAAVFTLPAFTPYVHENLKDMPDIHIGGVVSFPGGGDTTSEKCRQADELLRAGCDEIDMVMNLTRLLSNDDDNILYELKHIRRITDKHIMKVIIEAPHLNEEQIRRATELCITAKADYVKTSTGWYPDHPTKPEHIRVIADQAKGRIRIKAAGGVRDIETIMKMQEYGCDRFGLGMNSVIGIINGMN